MKSTRMDALRRRLRDRWSRRPLPALELAVAAILLLTPVAVLFRDASLQDLPLGRSMGEDAMTLEVEFVAVDRVSPGAEVRWGQQRVGRVADLRTRDGHAVAVLSIAAGTRLPAGVTASIDVPSALGSSYIQLTAPAAGEGDTADRPGDGSVIPLARTRVGPDIPSQLVVLTDLVNGSGIDRLRDSIRGLTEALSGQGENLGRNVNSVIGLVEAGARAEGDIGAITAASERLAEGLDGANSQLTRGLGSLRPLVADLAAQRDAIHRLLSHAGELSRAADDVLRAGGADGPAPVVTALNRVLRETAAYNERVRPTLDALNTLGPAFVRGVPGDYLLFDGDLLIPQSFDQLLTGGQGPEALFPTPRGNR